ncbi:DNA-binding response regulator, NarL/FixJ family, contains REC and HTH domains [Ignavigranum ruoffiae]|uniref:DNA-binding response regulator, NarL/FixJ family, contains REC and HTH domains n=1 Tax=Ignavigranum ruoffiae TaxID=89093 RepID=A0A1H9GH63_9LACT|nr:response regulator transcription factor [Ignavigranum ruoffiae]SEQ49435.1 DNA-binding response regulator, NarL/FixJ family, contains REC and HTH domains [Ignavigranum ruoffiae]
MIKLMIVDDEMLIRSGLAILLSGFSDIEVAAEAANGQEALDCLQKQAVDVILMDVQMPVMDGIEATRQIKNLYPEIKIIILTTFQDMEYISQAMQLGASGYLLKDSSHQDIYDGIKLSLSNKLVLDQGVSDKIIKLDPVQPRSERLDQYQLTPKEIQILEYLAQGLNNKEIAEAMFLSEGTIKNNVSYLLTKLNLRDRTQLAIFAFKHGLAQD